MRFLVDECVGPAVAAWLRGQGHDVYSVYEQARGTDDEAVIATAAKDSRILITDDKDFGEKVYRDQVLHAGVILLRLTDQSPVAKVAAIERLLTNYPERVPKSFVVVTENQVRFGKSRRPTPDQ
ncbi:MAG: hypothetical protein A2Z18_09645 [Armatimonadetes bacterium RBG_16_58_9]|nr:MAG: hypothetical protein A2Z18_09645 [Armatimonadetes bacterium RBG_16_58_9]